MISILHPSRQRPDRSLRTLTKWINNSVGELEIIISIDEDDPCLGTYEMNSDNINAKLIINKNRSAVDAINNAAKAATGNILIVVSDDTDCPDKWDYKLLQEVKGKTDWILKTRDGIQDWIITMPVMDRAFYNRFGYVYYPEYLHMFCDTELSCVADLTCRRLKTDMMFKHLHYSKGLTERDEVSAKADSTWTQGEKLFLSRFKNKFGLESPKCKVSSMPHLRWIQTKLK